MAAPPDGQIPRPLCVHEGGWVGGRGEGTPLVNCRMHPITGNKPKNVGKTRDSVTEGERKTNLREREGGRRLKREGGIDS